jgi:uncharacterized membrane protein
VLIVNPDCVKRDWDVERSQSTRLVFVDAGRGFAMLFVCLSHFAFAYFSADPTSVGGRTHEVLNAIGMVASPTFVLISGFLLGFLYRIQSGEFGPVRRRMIDRGIFLLTIGHALILLAHTGVQVTFD